MNSNRPAVKSNRTAVNSNQTIGNSIFAITEASIAKSGKNVNGIREVKSFAVNSAAAIELLLTAISPSLVMEDNLKTSQRHFRKNLLTQIRIKMGNQ